MRFLTAVVWIVAMLALVVAPALAQTQAPAPAAPVKPAPGAAAPAEKAPEKAKEVEGTVKKVDPATKSVQVSSGLLGLFGATLEVDDQTKINVQGKDKASLTDIREGAKVKASYESRDGKNVAKSIEVMPEEMTKPTPPARPMPPGVTPPGSSPSGSTAAPGAAPSTGQPKAP